MDRLDYAAIIEPAERLARRRGSALDRWAIVILLSGFLVLTGCGHSNQDETAPKPGAQAVQSSTSEGRAKGDELSGEALSRINDAKIYCLGMMLYAAKNQNRYPTNLDQTLPYLREANRMPSGTNRFDILYRGSLDRLPKAMTNGIIVLRSQSWEGGDGKWSRVYGFADGHCEVHSQADSNFDAWEKQHSAQP